MLSRLARWWLTRDVRRMLRRQAREPYVPQGECCAPSCGLYVEGDDLHRIVALSDDDAALGIEGQTGMAADFCDEHCPGGCLHGCVESAA